MVALLRYVLCDCVLHSCGALFGTLDCADASINPSCGIVAIQDARVQSVLGHNLASGSLKAFSFEPGHFSLTKRLAWVAPRAQVLFQVRVLTLFLFLDVPSCTSLPTPIYCNQVSGEKGEGFATAEAVQQPNGLVFNLLALDVIPPASSGKQPTLLVVHGREEKLHVRGSLRGFLQGRLRVCLVAQLSSGLLLFFCHFAPPGAPDSSAVMHLQSDRAAYIPQDRSAPSDEELVREQAELPSEDPEIASSGRA
jgi:hypothetical protein